MTVRSKKGLFASDEELGKRNDDHKPGKMGTWNIKHRPALRKRRILGAIAACAAVWLFIRYIPTDVGPHPSQLRQPPHQVPRQAPKAEKQAFAERNGELAAGERLQRTAPVLQSQGDSSGQKLNYNGPIKFYELASSLKEASSEESSDEMERNVLFAASDLSAAAAIIPVACEMGSWKRNIVHFAIMGPSEQSLDTIKHVNGATEESCPISWHDARPDYGSVSSHGRIANAVAGAIGHIGKYLQPVAFVTATLDDEDSFFELGFHRKVKEHRFTHIQVPKKDPSSLGWLARLDAAALSAWHDATFDIMVQAPLDSSGFIIRLLKSLAAADYRGFNPPRLTVELPHKIDERTQNFLRIFEWPPRLYSRPDQNVQLSLKRRITEQKADVAESSLRFIESFYPTAPNGPHVLLLSSQVELSSKYFHYLKLHLLEFKHSGHAFATSRDIFGLSMEAPSSFLNGSKFSLPDDVKKDSPFRWQAPNGHAALYFADKWIEAHSFLTKRHSASSSPKSKGYLNDNAKLVTTDSPAWVEYFLEFMRNRGWSLHYPALPSDSAPNMVSIVHNELSQAPEEFQAPPKLPTWEGVPPSSDTVLTVRDDYLSSQPSTPSHSKNAEGPLLRHIDALLPPPPSPHSKTSDEDDYLAEHPIPLSRLASLPLLDNLGQSLESDDLLKRAESVRIQYRQQAGGCTAARAEEKEREMYPFQAEDLFCFDEDRVAAGPPSGTELDDRARPDTDTDAAAAAAPDVGTKTQDHVPGGDGAAAIVDRVRDPAHYEETARAGFKKKVAGGGQAPPAAAVPPAAAAAAAAAAGAGAAIPNTNADRRPEPQQPSYTTPENQPEPANPALNVNRVQNPAQYEETARAGFAKKLSEAAAKARQEQDASKDYLRADADATFQRGADAAKKLSEAAAKARQEQDASKDFLRAGGDSASGVEAAGKLSEAAAKARKEQDASKEYIRADGVPNSAGAAAGVGTGAETIPNRADAGSSKAPSDGGVGAKPAAAGAIPAGGAAPIAGKIPNPVADANQVKVAEAAADGDSPNFPVIDPADPILGEARARGDEMGGSQAGSGDERGKGAVVGGKGTAVGGKVGRIRVGDESTGER